MAPSVLTHMASPPASAGVRGGGGAVPQPPRPAVGVHILPARQHPDHGESAGPCLMLRGRPLPPQPSPAKQRRAPSRQPARAAQRWPAEQQRMGSGGSGWAAADTTPTGFCARACSRAWGRGAACPPIATPSLATPTARTCRASSTTSSRATSSPRAHTTSASGRASTTTWAEATSSAGSWRSLTASRRGCAGGGRRGRRQQLQAGQAGGVGARRGAGCGAAGVLEAAGARAVFQAAAAGAAH